MAQAEPAEMPRGLIRSLRADPDHAPERLVLFAVERQAEEARRFAAAVPAGRSHAEVAAAERRRVLRISRLDGAIAGTPFLLALVPAYVAFLWEQVRMVLRLAALEGRDPADPRIVAELLAFRGVYPTADEAAAALATLPRVPGRRLAGGRRGLIALVRRLAVLGGFLGPPSRARPSRVRQALTLAGAGVLWAITWIVPVTFMLAMTLSCGSSTRALADRALGFYGIAPARPARERSALGAALLALSVAIPLGLLAWGATDTPGPLTPVRLLFAFAGLALVLALAGVLRTR